MSNAEPIGLSAPRPWPLATSHAVPPASPTSRTSHTPDVRAAIAQAAAATGTDFGYLIGQARLESSMDPAARASTSSASGLYQFIDNTWLETMDRHGARLGFAGAADAIESRAGRARVSDPAQRDAILALRFDPQAASLMAGALAGDNRAALAPVLGRDPAPAELYMAHFLGSGGATKFFTALKRTPDMAAASLLPKAAGANRAIFYTGGGAPRSVAQVMQLFEGKMDRAMAGVGSSVATSTGTNIAPVQSAASPPPPEGRAFNGSLPLAPALPNQPQRVSMAEILRGSFGEAGLPAAAQSRVSRAYAKLEAFGL